MSQNPCGIELSTQVLEQFILFPPCSDVSQFWKIFNLLLYKHCQHISEEFAFLIPLHSAPACSLSEKSSSPNPVTKRNQNSLNKLTGMWEYLARGTEAHIDFSSTIADSWKPNLTCIVFFCITSWLAKCFFMQLLEGTVSTIWKYKRYNSKIEQI